MTRTCFGLFGAEGRGQLLHKKGPSIPILGSKDHAYHLQFDPTPIRYALYLGLEASIDSLLEGLKHTSTFGHLLMYFPLGSIRTSGALSIGLTLGPPGCFHGSTSDDRIPCFTSFKGDYTWMSRG